MVTHGKEVFNKDARVDFSSSVFVFVGHRKSQVFPSAMFMIILSRYFSWYTSTCTNTQKVIKEVNEEESSPSVGVFM